MAIIIFTPPLPAVNSHHPGRVDGVCHAVEYPAGIRDIPVRSFAGNVFSREYPRQDSPARQPTLPPAGSREIRPGHLGGKAKKISEAPAVSLL